MNKKVLLLSAAVMMIFAACSVSNVTSSKPSDVSKPDTWTALSKFEKISIAGSFDVKYKQGGKCAVMVKGDSEALDMICVRSEGGTLQIESRSDMEGLLTGKKFKAKDVEIIVTSPDLISVSIAGSGDFTANGLVDTDNLKLSVAGSGDITMKNVICNSVKASIAGSGEIDVNNIVTADAHLSIAGSGDMDFRFKDSGKVKYSIAGSGDIRLRGTVKECTGSVAGSGDVNRKELKIK